jgi:hypothetical protein
MSGTTNQINSKETTHSENVLRANNAIAPIFTESFVAPAPILIAIAPVYGVYRLIKRAMKK